MECKDKLDLPPYSPQHTSHTPLSPSDMQYEISECNPSSLTPLIKQLTPNPEIMNTINSCRAQISELYQVHQRDGAELIFSSDGTGFGKSYGVFEGYAHYLEHTYSKVKRTTKQNKLLPKGGFTNFLFMSPQKAQIDLNEQHIQRIKAAGGEFICVLSQEDTKDLKFSEWITGTTNKQRYLAWCQGKGKEKNVIAAELTRLKTLIHQSDGLEKLIATLDKDRNEDKDKLKIEYQDQHQNLKNEIYQTVIKAGKNLFKDPNANNQTLQHYIEKGLKARQLREAEEQATVKKKNMALDEVYPLCRDDLSGNTRSRPLCD